MHPPERQAGHFERFAYLCFVLLIAALPWSIAAMSIGVVLAAAATLALRTRVAAPIDPTPVAWPALGWLLALGLSATFALDPAGSLPGLKKALLPALVVLAAFHTVNPDRGAKALAILLLSSACAAAFGVVSFLSGGGGLAGRARGPVGHYMTFGGQLLLLVSVALGVLLRARGARWRALAGTAALLGGMALACTYTRSAWLGMAVSSVVIVAAGYRRLVPLLAVVLAAAIVLAPAGLRERLWSSFDPQHPHNIERTHMWRAGAQMFLDRPLTGVGLQDLKPIAPRYLPPAARETPGHLHSVPMQIAATMGVVGLAAFALLYGSMVHAATRGLGAQLAAGGLGGGVRLGVAGALAGFLVAGLFEWNFGDEELLDLLYVLVGIAWAARRWPPLEAASPAAPSRAAGDPDASGAGGARR